MAKHVFTGVFVPANIWLSKELSPAEKMILGEVDALSKETGWCYAGRKHFTEWLHCTPQNITYYINNLERLGYLNVQRNPGERSRMQIINERFYAVGSKEGLPVTGSQSSLPGSQSSLRVGSQSSLPGSQSSLPPSYIQDKYKNEIQEKENPFSPPFTKVTVIDPETPGFKIVDIQSLEAEKEKAPPVAAPPPAKKKASKTQEETELAGRVIEYLNKQAGRNFRVNAADNAKGIISQARQGFTEAQMCKVIDFKIRQWSNDDKMREHLNPVTLFRPSNFERYLNAATLPPVSQGPQNPGRGATIVRSGGDPAKYEEKQVF